MSRRRSPVLAQLVEGDRARLRLPSLSPPDPIGPLRSLRARSMAWTYRHRVSLSGALPLVALTLAVRAWGIAHGPPPADDEGTYLAQAWAVQHLHALAPYTYWYDHPPLGWLQLAGWTSLTGTFTGHTPAVVSGRELMVLCAGLDAGLLFLLGRRLGLRRRFAAASVLAFALSPLAVGMSRMVYLDNLALPWLLAAFVLAASPRRDLWAHVGSGLCFAVAVLTKETSILVLPGLVLLLWQSCARQTRTFCLTGFATAFVLLTAAYPLLALLKGELLPGPGHVSLLDAIRFQVLTRPSTGSPLVAHTISREVVQGWLQSDALLPLLGALSLLPTLLVRRTRPVGVALGVLLVSVARPGYLPQPLVLTVLPFAALSLGAAADVIWACAVRPRTRTRRTLALASQGLLAVAGVAILCTSTTQWVRGDRALAAVDHVTPMSKAESWLEAHHQQGRLLVDDTMWADLASHGYAPAQLVWYSKLDFVNNLDPSVRRRIHRWSDLSVIVSSPIIRTALDSTPRSFGLIREAEARAHVLAVIGSGSDQIEILAVERPGTPGK